MANLDDVVGVLRAAGVTVHETYGWSTRGYAGQDLAAILGILWHHTATNRGAFANDPNPTTNTLVNGRPDLAGPLCNLQLGRDGSVTVIATGVANHAGRGSAPGIPLDAGNHFLIGIEMESSGIAPFDWTPAQIHWAPIVGAALEKHYLQVLPPEQRLQLGHMEYSSEGKIDPAGWPGGMDGLRAAINTILDAKTPPAPAPKPAPKPVPVRPAPVMTHYVPDPHWEVDPGDTLGKIAAWAKTSVPVLANYNGVDPDVIRVGEWIWPPVGQGTWTVDPGDTLSKIAGHYARMTVDRLCFANGINDASKINVGQRLQIPLS